MFNYAQPDTCFMFAYDLENEKLLWRSADQTYNSMNFLVKGDVIFCGYGFTAEDDYLYRLDKNIGEVIDRLPLKKMPDLMKSIVLLPETQRILEQMGLQIKYARLRRKLPSELVAERAGISRTTLVSIEKGSPSVAMGCYAAVLHALNYMDKDLLLVAKDDELGRKLQDLDLPVRKRAPKREKV